MLRASGFKYKQQDVSALASKAWEGEPTVVQNQYRRLAQDCSTILLEMRRNMLGDTERDWRTYMSPNGGEIIFASIISSEDVAADSPCPLRNNSSIEKNEKFIWENNFSMVEPSTHVFNTTHILSHLLPDTPTSHPSPTTGSEYHFPSFDSSLNSSSPSSSYLSNRIGESQPPYSFHYEITTTSPIIDLPTPDEPPHFTWSDLNYVTPLDFHEVLDDENNKEFQYPSTNSAACNDNGNQSSSSVSCSNRGGENNFYFLQDCNNYNSNDNGIFTPPPPQIVHWSSFDSDST
ncbi:9461_t:CDS:2 [Ambispora gerdemannii]|uniref:9461_t:CDS:1 n=1 Tax=Ambispora gerdemannii TaxID=144530 RepID=A0A9N9BQF0_9GLOM|nr:9461_t:CDS:2 [Ambispora gerdemannii]